MRLMSVDWPQAFDSCLDGDTRIDWPANARITEPLSLMGARIATGQRGTAPLQIHGGQRLIGIDYPLPVASAQIKSGVLLAGLYAEGATRVTEPADPRPYRANAGRLWLSTAAGK